MQGARPKGQSLPGWAAAAALVSLGAVGAGEAVAQGWTPDGQWVERGEVAERYQLPGRVGRLAEAEGRVWVFDIDDNAWVEARRNRPLAEGDRIAVDRGARAVVRIGATALWLDEGTDLLFDELDDDRTRLQLLAGSMALRVPSREDARELEVVTPEGSVRPLRSGHYRIDREDGQTFAAAWSGELRFDGGGIGRRIDDGERLRFWQDDRSGAVRADAVDWPRDRFGHWAASEYRELSDPPAYRYASPDITGVEELDRWGRWDQHPEFGFVWFPHTVPAGWAPYRDGRWVWMRPWGWTWADAAPWGFAPFHYGRWVQWHGRWAWWPGARHHAPVFSPGLVVTTGGPGYGVSVVIGGHRRPPPPKHWHPLPPRQGWVPIHRPPPVVHVHPPAYRHPPFVGHAPARPYPQPLPGRRHPRPPEQVWTGPVSPGGAAPAYGSNGLPVGVTPVPRDARPAPPQHGGPPPVAGRPPDRPREGRPPRADEPLPRSLPPPSAVFGPSPEVGDIGAQPTVGYRREVIRDAREAERRESERREPRGAMPPELPSAMPPRAMPQQTMPPVMPAPAPAAVPMQRGPAVVMPQRPEGREAGPPSRGVDRADRGADRAERGPGPERREQRGDGRRRDQVQ